MNPYLLSPGQQRSVIGIGRSKIDSKRSSNEAAYNEAAKDHREPRILRWFNDSWPYLVRDAGSVGLAVVAILVGIRPDSPTSIAGWLGDWLGWLFVATVIVTVSGTVLVQSRSRRLSELQTENDVLQAQIRRFETEFEQLTQDHSSIISDRLTDLANNSLGFGDTERVSLYKHDGRAFIMIGRYAKNPRYDSRGRGVYPDNEGCIGTAWSSGEAIEPTLPDPDTEFGRYLDENRQRWGMPIETTSSLKMKSRSFAAFALDNRNSRRIAVIVFESTQIDRLNVDRLRSTIQSDTEGRWLAGIIEFMKPIEPSPSYAYRKGF